MSYDELDAARDAYIETLYQEFAEDPETRREFYEELYDEIVQDFTDARLRSYYTQQPDLAQIPLRSLTQARELISHNATAAFIFAAIAAEVGVRSTLLTPIVYGLVHTDSAASLIVRLSLTKADENLMKLLLDLLAAHGGLDLRSYKRDGIAKSIWEELGQVRKRRNFVVHQADLTSVEETELALAVASCVLDKLFPTVVGKLGLHLHGHRVCESLHGKVPPRFP